MEGGSTYQCNLSKAGFQKVWFLIPTAIPIITEYNLFSKVCLLNKDDHVVDVFDIHTKLLFLLL